MWCVVYEQADGSVRVRKPARSGRLKVETDAGRQKRYIESAPEGVVRAVVVDEADLPRYDSAKRYAWRLKDGRVIVDETVPAPEQPKTFADLEAQVADLKSRLDGMTAKEVTGRVSVK